jgi:hypothetical protein
MGDCERIGHFVKWYKWIITVFNNLELLYSFFDVIKKREHW